MITASSSNTLMVCSQCDWVTSVDIVTEGKKSRCSHCHHVLISNVGQRLGKILVYGGTALLMLLLASSFSFLSFSSVGVTRTLTLWQDVSVLLMHAFTLFGALILLLVFVLPIVYLSCVMVLSRQLQKKKNIRLQGYLIRVVMSIHSWLMVDVFLIGILVALIKMQSQATIGLGLSFWAFCGYVVCLIKTMSLVDIAWFWQQINPQFDPISVMPATAFSQQKKGCNICGSVVLDDNMHCDCCGHLVHSRTPNSIKMTIALLLASLIMYIPANVFPIMETTYLGVAEPSTIVSGVITLWGMGSYPVAIIILIASVFIPIAKMLMLAWLCWQSRYPTKGVDGKKMAFYRMTELVGRWSMIDVFVVAILTGLVQLGGLVSILPGSAILCFASVVILTMLAAKVFDPRLLWDKK